MQDLHMGGGGGGGSLASQPLGKLPCTRGDSVHHYFLVDKTGSASLNVTNTNNCCIATASLSLPPIHCHHWCMAVLPDYYLKIIGGGGDMEEEGEEEH